jgi:uncharacterized membrane protein
MWAALVVWALCEGVYIWLTSHTYLSTYGHMATVSVNPAYALASYIALLAGLIYFVGSFTQGLVYGLAVYGVFNFTNLTLFPHFSLALALQDTVWGMCACALYGYLVKI